MFRVVDLKQMGYCERLIYYEYCLPALRVARPPLVQLGAACGKHVEQLELRRSLRKYGLHEGTRHMQVWLESETLSLCGQLDMLIETPQALIPVDFKDSEAVEASTPRRMAPTLFHQWKLQLAAYAMLVEEQWRRPVERGFIFVIPRRRAYAVQVDAGLRAEVQARLAAMRTIVEREQLPPSTLHRARCRDCEYRRFCNDV
ncbi:MAG: CRISPR-associated protein Cas4 [Thermoflexales bacterium]|nr:CRISPR-associated protein Cas4 [Thermoflexales bacterium]MDW8292835.1 CRISPR-associated protein Cas4 [Anaerolineae bacterium]